MSAKRFAVPNCSDPSIVMRLSGIRNIVGTRIRLAHGYDDISYRLVWDIVDIHVPALKRDVETLLNETPESSPDSTTT